MRNAEKSEMDVIDANTFQVIHNWPIAPGKGASGLAIDRSTMHLFAGCDNKLLVVMDANNGKVVTTLPIGEGWDAVGFDRKLKTVYSSNGDGTLTIIREESPDQFTVIGMRDGKRKSSNARDFRRHLYRFFIDRSTRICPRSPSTTATPPSTLH